MSLARDKHTLEPVDAEELWHIRSVDKNGYICMGCDLKAIPCSYIKGVNKKRPYFRFDDTGQHDEDCFVGKQEKAAGGSRQAPVKSKDGKPLSHPSILVLNDARAVESTSGQNPQGGPVISRPTKGVKPTTTNGPHNYSVKTINSIAKHFIDFRRHARTMPLSIEGIEGTNYSEVIKELPFEVVQFLQKKLRFGLLKKFDEMTVQDDQIVLTLINGNWVNQALRSTFNVCINTAAWEDSKKDYVVELVRLAKQEVKEKRAKKVYVFFIGEQAKSSPKIFVLNDYRLFTCVSAS